MRSSSLILFSYKIMHKRLFEAETLVPAVKPPSTFREPTHRRPERAKRKGAAPLPPRPECKGAALCRPGRNARFRPSVILSEANAVSAVEGSRAAPAGSVTAGAARHLSVAPPLSRAFLRRFGFAAVAYNRGKARLRLPRAKLAKGRPCPQPPSSTA